MCHLHYRSNDTGHNQAGCCGIYDTEEKAIAGIDKLYELYQKQYKGYGLVFEATSYGNTRKVSEEGDREADTDEFTIEKHEIDFFPSQL